MSGLGANLGSSRCPTGASGKAESGRSKRKVRPEPVSPFRNRWLLHGRPPRRLLTPRALAHARAAARLQAPAAIEQQVEADRQLCLPGAAISPFQLENRRRVWREREALR